LLIARRGDKLATNYDPAFWAGQVEQHTRVAVSLKALCSAVIASGDTLYSRLDQFPYGISFGLALGSRAERADVTRGWRQALAGQLLDPIALAIPGSGGMGAQELVLLAGGQGTVSLPDARHRPSRHVGAGQQPRRVVSLAAGYWQV
jgi:hypothetical protein